MQSVMSEGKKSHCGRIYFRVSTEIRKKLRKSQYRSKDCKNGNLMKNGGWGEEKLCERWKVEIPETVQRFQKMSELKENNKGRPERRKGRGWGCQDVACKLCFGEHRVSEVQRWI